VALIAAAFVLLNWPAMRRGLGYDELFTASQFVVGVPLWKTATSVVAFNNHIGYSLAAGLTSRLFGPAEWAVRLPALVCGIATVYVVWRLTRLISGAPAALLGAALLALSPFYAVWSRSARGYTALGLMAVVSTYGFFALLRRGSKRTAALHAVATTLAIYVHLYGVWIFVIQYACFMVGLARSRMRSGGMPTTGIDRRGLRLLWISFGLVVGMTACLDLPVVSGLAGVVSFRGRTPVRTMFPMELLHALVGTDALAVEVGVCVLAAVGFLQLRRRSIEAGYLVALFAIPLCAMWLVARPLDLYTRFFTYLVPFFASLVAVGLVRLAMWAWTRTSRIPRLGALALAMGAAIIVTILAASWVEQDLRPAPQAGYREALTPLRGPAPSFAVGGDARMFDYYAGKSLRVVHFLPEMDQILRDGTAVRVAYHDMTWNSAEDRQIAALLERRCVSDTRATVTVFRCGAE
jgi:hypothetical protein